MMEKKFLKKIKTTIIIGILLATMIPILSFSIAALEDSTAIGVRITATPLRWPYPDGSWHLVGVIMTFESRRDGSTHTFYTDGGIGAEMDTYPPSCVFAWYYPQWNPLTWSGWWPATFLNIKTYNFGGICLSIHVNFDYYVDGEYRGHFEKWFYD